MRRHAIEPVRPTVVEVDLAAIRGNLERLSAAAGDAKVCAVVKADGYGHGAVPVARAALQAGAVWLAVALVEEAEALRAAGIDAPILLLSEPVGQNGGAARDAMADRVLATGVTPSVATTAFADLLARHADGPIDCHLVVDTGMGRVGCRPDEVAGLLAHPGLHVTGAWTHLARADEDTDTTAVQLQRWQEVVDLVRAHDADAVLHAANSAAILRHPSARLDMVRAGIALYGLSPAPDLPAVAAGLRQVLHLRTAVAHAKHVPAGTPLSYGHTFTTPTPGWVATLPIGYADGVPRSLSNRAEVVVAGRRHRIAGRVTMDQTMVFTGDHEPAVGDEVVLLGGVGAPDDDTFVSVDEWAAIDGTISYEIACRLTARVPRLHHG